MWLLFKQSHHIGIVLASFIIFIILNTIENLIHFSIGRGGEIEIIQPNKSDWIKIIFIMIVFAILQSIGTLALTKL